MKQEVVFGNVMTDCNDEKIAKILWGLLGWEMCELFGRPAVRSSTGVVFLFIEEPDYVRPKWPEENGEQIHFDFQVDNVLVMVEKAKVLCAVKAKSQYGGDNFITILDPSGHPLCLCRK